MRCARLIALCLVWSALPLLRPALALGAAGGAAAAGKAGGAGGAVEESARAVEVVDPSPSPALNASANEPVLAPDRPALAVLTPTPELACVRDGERDASRGRSGARTANSGLMLSGEVAGELAFTSDAFSVVGPFRIGLSTDDSLHAQLSLRAPEAALSGLVLRNLKIEAQADAAQRVVAVSLAEFSALGGRVALRPFAIDFASDGAPFALSVVAELRGLSLAQLTEFVPEALREASGHISGQVALRWSAASGLQIGEGALSVDSGAESQLTLAAMPGFLTQHATRRIQILPASFGRIARWLSLENPAYDTMEAIELGMQPLVVESLSVALYPDGPAGPRSAVVSLVARPVSGAIVKRLRFDINVSGPLDQVLRFATQ